MMIKIKIYNNSDWLKDNGYSVEDEEQIYDNQLHDVYLNPRWYLDNLSFMKDYRLSWANYHKRQKFVPTVPRRYVKEKHL